MDWDFSEGFDEPAAPTTTERELLPEGTHELLIKEVRVGDLLEVRLAHEDRRYGWVFCRLPKDASWAKTIGRSLVAALGMDDAKWKAADPSDVADRLVQAELYHKVGRDGRTWVNVRRFLPVEKPAAAPIKKSPPRTAGEKAMKQAMETSSDDIPF
jgi:hypothetical protein